MWLGTLPYEGQYHACQLSPPPSLLHFCLGLGPVISPAKAETCCRWHVQASAAAAGQAEAAGGALSALQDCQAPLQVAALGGDVRASPHSCCNQGIHASCCDPQACRGLPSPRLQASCSRYHPAHEDRILCHPKGRNSADESVLEGKRGEAGSFYLSGSLGLSSDTGCIQFIDIPFRKKHTAYL